MSSSARGVLVALVTLAAVSAAAAVVRAQQYDCRTLVCDPCERDAEPVDFVFVVDASGSMQQEITRVGQGLSRFIQEVATVRIDPRYWVVLVGTSRGTANTRTELVVGGDAGETDATKVQRAMLRIRAAATVSGLHYYKGGTEPSLEAIRMALGRAQHNAFVASHVGGSGRLRLRGGKVVLLMLTDEDSDAPVFSLNAQHYFGSGAVRDPSSWSSGYSRGPAAEELRDTIAAVAQSRVYLYQFVNKRSGVSRYQFGDPDCDKSDADLSNFERDATLDCLRRGALGGSLQAGVLSSSPTAVARTFNVLDIEKAGFVESVFVEIVADIAQCQLKRKREAVAMLAAGALEPGVHREQYEREAAAMRDWAARVSRKRASDAERAEYDAAVAARHKRDVLHAEAVLQQQQKNDSLTCVQFRCGAEQGCYLKFLCADGCPQCKIGDTCYGLGQQRQRVVNAATMETEPTCDFCDPYFSRTAWTPCSGRPRLRDNGPLVDCMEKKCFRNFFQCSPEPTCTKECDYCFFEEGGYDTCFRDGWARDGDACQRCRVATRTDGWTDVCPKCAPSCKNGGRCVYTAGVNATSGPTHCDCSESQYVGADCATEPTCPAGPCQNGARCVQRAVRGGGDGETEFVCDCSPTGYTGDDCSQCTPGVNCPAECTPPCANGGTCELIDPAGANDGPTRCNCDATGFQGATCEDEARVPCEPACANGGDCLADGSCRCTPAWRGDDCSEPAATANAPSGEPTGKGDGSGDGNGVVIADPLLPDALRAQCADDCAAACHEGFVECRCFKHSRKEVVCARPVKHLAALASGAARTVHAAAAAAAGATAAAGAALALLVCSLL